MNRVRDCRGAVAFEFLSALICLVAILFYAHIQIIGMWNKKLLQLEAKRKVYDGEVAQILPMGP